MAVFVELVTDIQHNYYAQNMASQTLGRSRAGRSAARRPVRGLEIKEDTYAMIKVIGADGLEVPLMDSGRKEGYTGVTNFILQQVQENRAEKQQILETFGDSYVFFFGESPKMLSCTAVLVNSNDFNWEAEWWWNYDNYLRGTKLVEMGARAYLSYDDTVVEGYFMRASVTKDANNPLQAMLQFEFFVTSYTNVSLINASDDFPLHGSTSIPEGIDLRADGSRFALQGVIGDLVRRREATEWYQRLPDYPPELVVGMEGGEVLRLARSRASGVFAADVEKYLGMSNTTPEDILFEGGAFKQVSTVVRTKISKNEDEYVGGGVGSTIQADYINEWDDQEQLEGIRPVVSKVRDQMEVQSLFKTAISILSCMGANINSPSSLQKLGMGVSFSSPTGIGFGASAGAKASFGPQPGGGWGASASASATSSAQAGGYAGASAGAYAGASAGAYAGVGMVQDPLGSVYGPSTYGPKDPRYNEGAGDPGYGYASAYAGAGFGQAGFGTFGGAGYGSGLGATGDPGFKDPRDFTIAGEPDTQSAVEKFFASKGEQSGSEYQTASGGPSMYTGSKVEGAVSAFAVASFSGTLDPTGNARQDPQFISDQQDKQKFGFAKDNPYGVPCLETKGGYVVSEKWKWP
jgi:hypothetical protein